MIKINNILINKYQIDFIEIREKENTVYIHLQGGTSFLFCRDDCRNVDFGMLQNIDFGMIL